MTIAAAGAFALSIACADAKARRCAGEVIGRPLWVRVVLSGGAKARELASDMEIEREVAKEEKNKMKGKSEISSMRVEVVPSIPRGNVLPAE